MLKLYNLSSGLEFAQDGIMDLSSDGFGWHLLRKNIDTFSYCRVQSTACEQKRFGHVLLTFPTEAYYRLALGEDVMVYDCGARKPIPRAIWQGLAWIQYCCYRSWRGIVAPYYKVCRASTLIDVTGDFDRRYRMETKALNELRYYKKLAASHKNGIGNLVGISCAEGDVSKYAWTRSRFTMTGSDVSTI